MLIGFTRKYQPMCVIYYIITIKVQVQCCQYVTLNVIYIFTKKKQARGIVFEKGQNLDKQKQKKSPKIVKVLLRLCVCVGGGDTVY